MSKQVFSELEISSIKKETVNSSRIRFVIPKSLTNQFLHKPGQYISIQFELKKKTYIRTYSISSEANDNYIEIGVKHIERGIFSEFLKTKKTGDKIRISKPEGNFFLTGKNPKKLLLIAAGSGITPMMSILKSSLKNETETKITLLFSNKTYADMMFKEDLQDIKDKYIDRLSVNNFFSREAQSTQFLNGRITKEKIWFLEEEKILNLQSIDQTFICGPTEMTKELKACLKKAGVSERKIKTELFFVKPTHDSKIISKNLKTTESKIEIVMDGSRKTFVMKRNEDFIEKANQFGINIPYSCKNGMCATCRCKLLTGKAKMKKNYSLEEWEIKKGFLLSCQLVPLDKEVSLDFDII